MQTKMWVNGWVKNGEIITLNYLKEKDAWFGAVKEVEGGVMKIILSIVLFSLQGDPVFIPENFGFRISDCRFVVLLRSIIFFRVFFRKDKEKKLCLKIAIFA